MFGLCPSSGTKVAFRFCPSGDCWTDLAPLHFVGWGGCAHFHRGVCEELQQLLFPVAFLSSSPSDGGAGPEQCGTSEVGELDAEGGIHLRIKGYK